MPAHARLEVLGRLVQAQQRGVVQADLTPLAKALTNDTHGRLEANIRGRRPFWSS